MADFQTAVTQTLQNEGGFVDNPDDSGGATNMGVEQRDIPEIPIRDLTVAQATDFYLTRYWKPFYSQIASQEVASKLFDMGVLFGVGEATYLLQRALNFGSVEWTKVFDVETLLATNEADSAALLTKYRIHLRAHALNLTNANPKDKEFVDGWLRRIDA